MRRLFGGIAIGMLAVGGCTSGAEDVADTAPASSTSAVPTTSEMPTTTVPADEELHVLFVDNNRACTRTRNDVDSVQLICAADDGFPGVRGATLRHYYAIAIVDPGTTVFAEFDGGDWEELDVQSIDGLSVVEAAPVTRLRWVSPDGSTGELPIGDETLGDDPISLDRGVVTVFGVDVDWGLWFTRARIACTVFSPPDYDEEYPVCLSEWNDWNLIEWSAGVRLPEARWCDQSPGGIVYGLGWIDPGTVADVRYGDREGEVRIHELPNGRTVALGFVEYDFPPTAEAFMTVTYEGQETRHRLGLPQPAGAIATYPDGCPDLTTPTTLPTGPTTTSPPTPTYPVYPSL